MKVKKIYNAVLRIVYGFVYVIAQKAQWKGRLLAMPVGVVMIVTLPLAKLGIFVEDIVLIINGIFFPSQRKAAPSLKVAALDLCSLIISPVVAIFVGIAMMMTLLNNPLKASDTFLMTCQRK